MCPCRLPRCRGHFTRKMTTGHCSPSCPPSAARIPQRIRVFRFRSAQVGVASARANCGAMPFAPGSAAHPKRGGLGKLINGDGDGHVKRTGAREIMPTSGGRVALARYVRRVSTAGDGSGSSWAFRECRNDSRIYSRLCLYSPRRAITVSRYIATALASPEVQRDSLIHSREPAQTSGDESPLP